VIDLEGMNLFNFIRITQKVGLEWMMSIWTMEANNMILLNEIKNLETIDSKRNSLDIRTL